MAQCMICGSDIPEGADACPVCGSAIGTTPAGKHRTREEWVERSTIAAGIKVGFSPKFDTPEFQAPMKKRNRRYSVALSIFGIILPLAGGILCAAIAGPLGFPVGLIAVGFFTFPFFLMILFRRGTGKQWDGEVIDLVHTRRDRNPDYYGVRCRTDEGKERTVSNGTSEMYNYFQIGDRVRFHPRLVVPLEKYDKTHDTYLLCPFCKRKQPLDVDYCTKCGKLLLK